ncbi:MAG: hypothetical protein ABIQ43_02570 [Sphingomonas sp.]
MAGLSYPITATQADIDELGHVNNAVWVKWIQDIAVAHWNDPPQGARFDRHVKFTGCDGKVKVQAVTTWALIDRATGRLLRVRPEIAAPFLG